MTEYKTWGLAEKIVVFQGETWNITGVYDINATALIGLQKSGTVEFFDMETVLLEGLFCPSVEVAAKHFDGGIQECEHCGEKLEGAAHE